MAHIRKKEKEEVECPPPPDLNYLQIHWYFGNKAAYLKLNANLPDPLNFIPFGTMRYSSFAINLINIHKYYLHMTCICLFPNKA